MLLLVEREPTQLGCTHGRLYVDGQYFCETLEDPIREIPGQPVAEWKIPGDTAIGEGSYKVVVRFSNHFQMDVLVILEVPGFSDVEVHPGNVAEDTRACLLVGEIRSRTAVHDSRHAFKRLFAVVSVALGLGQPVTIQYINPKRIL